MGMCLTQESEDLSLDSRAHVEAGCSVSLALENRDMRVTGALCSGTLATITSCGVSKRPHVKNKNHHQQQQRQVEKLLWMIREIRHWLPHVHTQESTVAQAHTNTHIKMETFNKTLVIFTHSTVHIAILKDQTFLRCTILYFKMTLFESVLFI